MCTCGLVRVNVEPHSDYQVEATAPGYRTVTKNVHVEYDPDCGKAKRQDTVEFRLEPL